MMEENKISVVINTYNAEQFLEEVLEAVSGFDEVVICDMESQDSTVAIAEAHGCRVVTFPKGNHISAEPARNFAIQSAKYKWVLMVDADEIVTPELRDYFYCKIQSANCPHGFYIPRRNRNMNVLDKRNYRDYQLRFFIREGTNWPPFVHTFPQVQGKVEKIEKGKGLEFIHLDENYISSRIEKINRYTEGEIIKKSSKNYGVISLFWRPFWRFFKSYLLDGQAINGVSGLITSMLDGYYQFVLVAKIIEKRMKDNDKKHVS